MKNLAKFSVDRAITVFMAVILVIVFGVVSYSRLSTDLFPSMNIPVSIVVTTYIGASPDEVEEVVTKPLEEVLSTTTNISTVTSNSQENVSIIILEFGSDANMDSAVIEMRENLDMVLSQLPDQVGNPMIIKINPDMMPIIQFSASAEGMTQLELTEYVNEEVLPQLERLSGVASVDMSGGYESEVRLVLDEVEVASIDAQYVAMQMMQNPLLDEEDAMHFDKEFISNILKAQNFAFPIGYLNIEGSNYLVRVGDDFGTVAELEDLILFDLSPMMEPVTLADILLPDGDGEVIRYINANEREYSKLNGNAAISVTIQKSSNFATTDVTKEVLALLDDISADEEVDFTILLDQGEYIEQATGGVTTNLMWGALLAMLVLAVFLRSARATLIVALAIPISLMFAIVLIYLSGITLNIVSLGGLALGIGMLVDNSIVVMENIFRLKKDGASNREAAIKGTQQVSGAIIASTITTIAVFLPIIFIEGFIKEIFIQMALTIAFSLFASLMIALTLVPAISSKILKENGERSEDEKPVEENKFKKGYEKLFKLAMKFKIFIIAGVVVLFFGSIGLSLQNGFEYFPESDEGQINVSIENPNVNPYSYEEFITMLDEFTAEVMDEFDDVETVGVTLGSLQNMFLGVSNSDSASASIILSDDREMSTSEIMAEIHNLLAENYPRVEFTVSGSQQQTSMLTGEGIQIQLQGFSLEDLQTEAGNIVTLLQDVDGLIDIDSGVGKESLEYKITVRKDDAAALFLNNAMILGQVAEAFAHESVVTTINEKGSLYDIYIYDSNSIDNTVEISESEIAGLLIMTPMGVQVPLSSVADIAPDWGPTTINRVNGSRTLTVTAGFADGVNVTDVSNAVKDILEDQYIAPEGYTYEILGEQEEVMEAVMVLVLAMGLAVLLIYMIMASQFQSLTYPFIIMFTIPLAFTGGFAILWLTNMTVSVVAIIGLIILVGVVVNNGIVLVDYTNQLREKGMGVKEALLEAGKTRLRPIVMTALTTILALSTMALGIGEGAEMMQPMAVTTIGGLLYATVLTLFLVPIMYYLVTEYGKQIFGFGGAALFLAVGIALIPFGFVLIGIVVILVALGIGVLTYFLLRDRSEIYE